MPVFYRGPLATITHEVISVPRVERHIMPIDELVAVHVVEVGSDDAMRQHRVLGVSALIPVLVVVSGIAEVPAILGVVVGLMLLVYAGACIRVRSGVRYQLVALAGDEWVTLLETADRMELERARRGLRRAFEYRTYLPRRF